MQMGLFSNQCVKAHGVSACRAPCSCVFFPPYPTCFNTVCVTGGHGSAWWGAEVDEVFIRHSQGKDGECRSCAFQ